MKNKTAEVVKASAVTPGGEGDVGKFSKSRIALAGLANPRNLEDLSILQERFLTY